MAGVVTNQHYRPLLCCCVNLCISSGKMLSETPGTVLFQY